MGPFTFVYRGYLIIQ